MHGRERLDDHRWARLRLRDGVLPAGAAARTLMHVVDAGRTLAVATIGVLVAGAWLVIHLAGGAAIAVPHGYYIPVVLAAVRFGSRGSLVTAGVAGVLAGPLTAQEVATATAQSSSEWLTRTVFFVLVGQLVAWLFAYALDSVRDDAALARDDRELAAAIAAGQLSLRYQPVFSIHRGHLVGAEALVRWDHPDGERGPASFLPTAERTGRIHQIGDLVLRSACEQAARWQEDARRHGGHAPVVSVNLSAAELVEPDLVDRVLGVLQDTGLEPRKLCLEVTEGALARDIEGTSARLACLRDAGVRIAIDDFGTGYSSLSYVHRFPFDLLKVDRSFVREMERSERARVLVHGIASLCHELGVQIVLEGVETEAQLDVATELRCELIQGYLLARPETVDRIEQRLIALRPGEVVRPARDAPAALHARPGRPT